MIISLAGIPGAGKTTVRDMLAARLGLTTYSTGDLFGKLAQERGMTIGEFNVYCMEHPEADQEVDKYQTVLGQEEDNFIMDSRLAWHFIPQSVKIFLDVDLDESARRVFADRKVNPKRADEPQYASAEEVRNAIEKRLKVDDARYQTLYGIHYLDRANYDLVIDTTHIPATEVVEQILTFLSNSATLRA